MNSKLKKLEEQLEEVKSEMNLYKGSELVGCLLGGDVSNILNIKISKEKQRKFNSLCKKCDKLEDKIEMLKDKLCILPS